MLHVTCFILFSSRGLVQVKKRLDEYSLLSSDTCRCVASGLLGTSWFKMLHIMKNAVGACFGGNGGKRD